jgi:hypothetical protein
MPILLEFAVKNRKFGDQFIEAATSGAISRGALESFPLVQRFIKENNENAGDSKVKGMLDKAKKKTPE